MVLNWLSVKMNIEDYREYCLSLGTDVEEKLPFQKFKSGEGEWPEIDDDRLISIDQTCEIAECLHAIAHIPQNHPMPKGNLNLYVQNANGDYIHDDFRHELALYIDGFLFTGCAHSGLENILAACPWLVHTVVGGFHLLDGMEREEEILALAQRLKAKYPETQFYTSHCTGDNVFEVMKDVMGERLQSFRCGTTKI